MADNEGARKTNKAYVACSTPDVCITGGTPVPYTIVSHLDAALMEVESVKMTGFCVLTMESHLRTVLGDEAGSGGGVTSGVNLGYCVPITHSGTVRAKGSHLLYHSSEFWMNCPSPGSEGNTKGKLFFPTIISLCSGEGDASLLTESDPPLPSTEEQSWYNAAFDAVSDAASDGWTAASGAVGSAWTKVKELNDTYMLTTRAGGLAQFASGELMTVAGGSCMLGAEAVLPAVVGAALIGVGQDQARTGWHNLVDPDRPWNTLLHQNLESLAESLGAGSERADVAATWLEALILLGLAAGGAAVQGPGTNGVRITTTATTEAQEFASSDAMLRAAVKKTIQFEGTPAQKAKLFEELSKDIAKTFPGWEAVTATGTDGSAIFIGTRGRVLVITPSGSIFTGPFEGLKTVASELFAPNYSILKQIN